MKVIHIAGALGLSVAAASPSFAHHSFAAFNAEAEAFVRGTITRYSLRNPHTYLFVEVTRAGGETVTWRIEGETRNDLIRAGWSEDSLERGDFVTVRVNPANDPDRPYGRLLSLEKADGTVLSIPNEEDEAGRTNIVPAESLEGVWLPIQTFFTYFGAVQPLANEAALAAREELQGQPPINAQCVEMALPMRLARAHIYELEFVSDDLILIHSEDDPVAREIHMDGRDHPESLPDEDKTAIGHSIGRWEGDTLVVDTRHFAPEPNGHGFIPSTDQKHMVERYTLSEDKTEIVLEVAVDDPGHLNGTIEQTFRWQHKPHIIRQPYSCDLEAAQGYLLEEEEQ